MVRTLNSADCHPLLFWRFAPVHPATNWVHNPDYSAVALLCAEKDPLTCHRMLLICRYLRADDVVISHILEDGALEDNRDTEMRLMRLLKLDSDDLFCSKEELIELAYNLQSEKVAYSLIEKA
ncbi:MAG: DUF488 domain-containing protein [Syntrophobacterales bacterium]|nr:DUF488 domain-containing protein [Syntrophobacterales bacterium]